MLIIVIYFIINDISIQHVVVFCFDATGPCILNYLHSIQDTDSIIATKLNVHMLLNI